MKTNSPRSTTRFVPRRTGWSVRYDLNTDSKLRIGRAAAEASNRCPDRRAGRNAETLRTIPGGYQVDRRPNNFSGSKIAQDLGTPVERGAAVERAAARARERAAGKMAYPLAVRADSYRGRRNDDFGARVTGERTLGTNLRENMGRHLVAAEHSDKRPPMSPPAAYLP